MEYSARGENNNKTLLHQTSAPHTLPLLPFFSKSRNNKKEQLFKDEEVLTRSFFSPTEACQNT